MQVRRVKQILTGTPAEDGAGVKLNRVLGTAHLDYLDPFLLLDEFKSESAGDYIAGFPSHPHRNFGDRLRNPQIRQVQERKKRFFFTRIWGLRSLSPKFI